jgi:hypothetical protein
MLSSNADYVVLLVYPMHPMGIAEKECRHLVSVHKNPTVGVGRGYHSNEMLARRSYDTSINQVHDAGLHT